MNMENKVVVITRGSSGLGRETALRLSRKKATVILVARTAATSEDTGQEIAGLTGAMPLALVCDIPSENSVYAATKFALRGFTIGLRHKLQS